MEPEAEEEWRKEEEREGDTQRGGNMRGDPCGGGLPTPEENTDLPNFTPECVHLLLQGV